MTRTAPHSTWEDLYRTAAERLGNGREARWLIEEASGEPYDRASGPAPEKARLHLADMVQRRLAGEPLQYVIGTWPFRQLELMVDRRVLIPRPETEQVVEHALAELARMGEGPKTVVDLGTGSGAIALSIAKERTDVEVWAVDVSPGAVEVARANLAGLAGFAATRVRILEGSWWEPLPASLERQVHLVVSNPPYVSSAEMDQLDPVVRDWEPARALEAGPDGTEAIAVVLEGAARWLAPTGSAVIEMAPHQEGRGVAQARAAGFREVEVKPDLSGRPRALVARR
jgi:release factor glutamine methyltransferase